MSVGTMRQIEALDRKVAETLRRAVRRAVDDGDDRLAVAIVELRRGWVRGMGRVLEVARVRGAR